jgi:hypothetical protein
VVGVGVEGLDTVLIILIVIGMLILKHNYALFAKGKVNI